MNVIDAICGLTEDAEPAAPTVSSKSLIPKDAQDFQPEVDKKKQNNATAHADKKTERSEPLIPTSVALVAPNATPGSEDPLNPQQVPGALAPTANSALGVLLAQDVARPAAPVNTPVAPDPQFLVQKTLESMKVGTTVSGSAPKTADAIAASLLSGNYNNAGEVPNPKSSVMAAMYNIFGKKLR